MGTPWRLSGPSYLGTSPANLVTPIQNIYQVVTLIHLCNTDTVAHWATIYIGTAGGSPGMQITNQLVIPPNGIYQIPLYAEMSYTNSDNLVALSDVANKVVLTVMGDKNVYPA